MSKSRSSLTDQPLIITADNIGGIDHTEKQLPPGVTVLAGENATNRSSFLQAIMAGLGSDRVSLKSDTDEGQVSLQAGDQTFTRTLTRTNRETVVTGGDPYLNEEDATLADLYAFLVEDNEVRQAVEREDDLYDILMRPVDKAEIERQQKQLKEKREALENDIEDAEAAANKVIELEEERTSLQDEIETLEQEIKDLDAEIEELEATANEREETNDEIDALQSDIDNKQRERQEVKSNIQKKNRRIEKKQNKLNEIDLPDISKSELESKKDSLESEQDDLYDEQSTLKDWESNITDAQQLNEDVLEGRLKLDRILSNLNSEDIPTGPLSDADSGDITDQLIEADTVFCQACGSSVDRNQIEIINEQYEAMASALYKKHTQLQERIDDLDREIHNIEAKVDNYEDAKETRTELKDDISRLEDEIAGKKETLEDLDDKIAELESERDALEPSPVFEELIEAKSERQSKQNELSRLESELEQIESKIVSKENEADREDTLREQKEDIQEELNELRTKIDEIETELVDQFNDEMENILDLLDYKNITRVWIDHREEEFRLTITRETVDGTAYEDQIGTLSESERNVIGLVVALTGYLVHDVHEICPVMVLDSIEMIDGKRINRLIDHFSSYQDYLVAALLPGDADAITLDDATMMNW